MSSNRPHTPVARATRPCSTFEFFRAHDDRRHCENFRAHKWVSIAIGVSFALFAIMERSHLNRRLLVTALLIFLTAGNSFASNGQNGHAKNPGACGPRLKRTPSIDKSSHFVWAEVTDREVAFEVERVLTGLRPLLVGPGLDLMPMTVSLRMNYTFYSTEDCSFDRTVNRLDLIFQIPKEFQKVSKNPRALWVHEFGHAVISHYLRQQPGIWKTYFQLIDQLKPFLELAKDPTFQPTNEQEEQAERFTQKLHDNHFMQLNALLSLYEEAVADVLAMTDQEDKAVINRFANLQVYVENGISEIDARERPHIALMNATPKIADVLISARKSDRPMFIRALLESLRLEIEDRYSRQDWHMETAKAENRFVSRFLKYKPSS